MRKLGKNTKFYGSLLIMIILYLVISNLPLAADGPLTRKGLQNLALLVSCVWGWCTLDMVIPTLIGFIAMGFISGNGIAGSFMQGLGSYIVVMLLPLLMICGIMMSTGFTKAIAMKMVNTKFANGKPWVIITLLMVVAAVLSLVLPGMAVVLVIWDLAYGIFESCGYEKGDKTPKVVLIAICSAATVGMMSSHLSTGVIPAVGMITAMDPSVVWKPLTYTGASLVMLAVFLVCNVLLVRFVFRPDVEKLRDYKAPQEKVPFTTDQKIAGILMLCFVLLVFIPAFLPQGSAVRNVLEGQWGLIGFGFLTVIVALIIHKKNGTPFMPFAEIEKSGLSWQLILMLAAIQVICGSMSAPEYGVSDWLVSLFSPILGSVSPFVAVLLLVILAVVVTNLLDSAITSLVFCVLTMTIAHTIGVNHLGLQAIMMKAAAYGMLLPACSPLLTLLYAKEPDGWIDSKEILKEAAPQIVMGIVVFAVIGYLTLNWF